jgi:hypothetical protein
MFQNYNRFCRHVGQATPSLVCAVIAVTAVANIPSPTPLCLYEKCAAGLGEQCFDSGCDSVPDGFLKCYKFNRPGCVRLSNDPASTCTTKQNICVGTGDLFYDSNCTDKKAGGQSCKNETKFSDCTPP